MKLGTEILPMDLYSWLYREILQEIFFKIKTSDEMKSKIISRVSHNRNSEEFSS